MLLPLWTSSTPHKLEKKLELKKAAIPCGSKDSGDFITQKVGISVGKYPYFGKEIIFRQKNERKKL